MLSKTKKKVCLFGLSANPPTIGHGSIVSQLASMRYDGSSTTNDAAATLFDEIRVLPVYKHMFSVKRDQAAFHHRLEMCRLTFKGIPNVEVSEQEHTLFEHVAAKRGV